MCIAYYYYTLHNMDDDGVAVLMVRDAMSALGGPTSNEVPATGVPRMLSVPARVSHHHKRANARKAKRLENYHLSCSHASHFPALVATP